MVFFGVYGVAMKGTIVTFRAQCAGQSKMSALISYLRLQPLRWSISKWGANISPEL